MAKTIVLTDEQLDLIVNSLLVASCSYYEQFEIMKKKFENEPVKVNRYWYDKGVRISNLADDIKNGSLDAKF